MQFHAEHDNADVDDDDEEDENDDDDDDDSSKVEGFRLLLGDDIITSLDASAWDNESVHSDIDNTTICKEVSTIGLPILSTSTPLIDTKDIYKCDQKNNTNDYLFSLAYTRNENHNTISKPNVAIINFDNEKGYGLISLQKFTKGSIIYTERATIATPANYASTITCCYNCFQSLEYITTCQGLLLKQQQQQQNADTAPNDNITLEGEELNKVKIEFPYPNLWPVLPLTWADDSTISTIGSTSAKFRIDSYKRMQCMECGKTFCSTYCANTFANEFGSCCLLSRIISSLPDVLAIEKQNNNNESTTLSNESTNQPNNTELITSSDSDSNDDDDDNHSLDVQCELLLAIRMFAYELQRHRQRDSIRCNNTASFSLLTDLCGTEDNLNELQIGIGTRSVTDNGNNDPSISVSYSLEPIYQKLIDVYSLSYEEQQLLSYSKFVLFTCQAARNGFGIIPQSPFQTYYNSLVRVTGRGTMKHEQVTKQVVTALGASKLDRTMDTIINQHVSVQLCAIFTLTARMNHCCEPYCNAQVQSGQYVNYNIDIVATKDIQIGEEILISYIEGSHRKRYNTRQRELYARYLFYCHCISCLSKK